MHRSYIYMWYIGRDFNVRRGNVFVRVFGGVVFCFIRNIPKINLSGIHPEIVIDRHDPTGNYAYNDNTRRVIITDETT